MSTMKPNTALLAKVLDQVNAEMKRPKRRRHYDQTTWRRWLLMVNPEATPACGTAMCVAGWAVELDPKSRWAITPAMVAANPTLAGHYAADEVLATPKEIAEDTTTEVELNGKKVHVIGVRHRAQRVLGLTYGQAIGLFDGNNSPAQVRKMITSLIETGVLR